MEKRWNLLSTDAQRSNLLQKELGINSSICSILVQRNLDSFEKARQFFRPSLNELHSPWLMKDMEKAVSRILLALRHSEKILVYGDYDVDGTTAVACMFHFISSFHSNTEFYVPHRYKEGYGVSKTGIEYAASSGVSLIISLDCGIKSTSMVEYAKTFGIDFIICDHHTPDSILPDAVAILDSKQDDCQYPFKELCGCGVGFKLIQALCEKLDFPDEKWMHYLDLVSIAIAADIVPINGENRILAYYGLQKVNGSPCVGVKTLLELAELKGEVHINNLVFAIAPRVNAAGRMDDARKAVQLFIEKNQAAANELAKQLHSDNTDRRDADATTTEQALALLEENQASQPSKKTTVLYREDWHKGVVGIVASRLIEKYYRPTIILTKSGEKVSGSARSVIGFNVYEAIHQCKELLENYGGHFYAAGLTMKEENVGLFQEKFEAVVSSTIPEALLTPEILIDAAVRFEEITASFYRIICQMEPFGPENMRPVFISQNVYETGYSRIVKDAHIKFSLKQDATIMDGIGFGLAHKFELLQPNVPLDVVYTLDENEWNGEKKLQLKVIDIKQSAAY